MDVTFTCPACAARVVADLVHAGGIGNCPACHWPIIVPDTETLDSVVSYPSQALPHRSKYTSWLVISLLMLVMSAANFHDARTAAAAHTFIPATGKQAWMTPGQGYTVSAACFLYAIFFLVRWW